MVMFKVKLIMLQLDLFTDYWRSKTIYSIIKIEDSNGNVILIGNEPKKSIKVNELKFNQDDFEQISINEYVGDIEAITILLMFGINLILLTQVLFQVLKH
jgi:hypothetical protein